jgi:membrane complex biogenesis BtpA family protein
MTHPLPVPRDLVGVVHLEPLPGAPGWRGDFAGSLARAVADAQALHAGGLRRAIVENFGDRPFFKDRVPAETVAALALAVGHIAERVPGLELGLNVLRNDARSALGLAAVVPVRFVRINVHVGAMVTDQGLIEGQAAETLRERQRLCPRVELWCDVHVKHALPLAGEDLIEAARNTLEGRATGSPPEGRDLARVRAACPAARLYLGSGLSVGNAAELLVHADGAIVGTSLKRGGHVDQPVDLERVRALVAASARL